MTRAELVRRFALDSFCDDYEDIEQITKYTDEVGPACGLMISHDDIIQALRELIELGYAKAWDFDPREREAPQLYPEMPSLQEIAAGACFKGTPEGLEFYKSCSLPPPFYWHGKLHEDWILPDGLFDRGELICKLILASIWDAYVTMEFIQLRMDDLGVRLRMTFSSEEIMNTLRDLIELGYAKAWRIDRGDPACEYVGMPPVEHIVPYRAYFWVTPEGLAFHLSDDSWWPFEESDDWELKLRQDWTPPNA